jgi:hypothetical protein
MIGVYPEACVSMRAADWFKHLVSGSEMRVLFLDDILWILGASKYFPPVTLVTRSGGHPRFLSGQPFLFMSRGCATG